MPNILLFCSSYFANSETLRSNPNYITVNSPFPKHAGLETFELKHWAELILSYKEN